MLTRLLILWLLSEGPLHGYRIKRILDDDTLRFWFPTEYGSIYAVLRTLERHGYVQALEVEQEGRRPARTRYRITPTGRDHLRDLLRQAWRALPSPAEPFQLALAARSELPDEEVAQLLVERRDALRARLTHLEKLERSEPGPEMTARQQALTQAELSWVEQQIAKEE
jgi:DNA-binding PadR family transcriptional regulator